MPEGSGDIEEKAITGEEGGRVITPFQLFAPNAEGIQGNDFRPQPIEHVFVEEQAQHPSQPEQEEGTQQDEPEEAPEAGITGTKPEEAQKGQPDEE